MRIMKKNPKRKMVEKWIRTDDSEDGSNYYSNDLLDVESREKMRKTVGKNAQVDGLIKRNWSNKISISR